MDICGWLPCISGAQRRKGEDPDDLFARDQILSILSETAGTTIVARWFKGPKQIVQRTTCIDGDRG